MLQFFVMLQNYVRQPWNVFDLVTVIGSIIDIVITFWGLVSIHHSDTINQCNFVSNSIASICCGIWYTLWFKNGPRFHFQITSTNINQY